MAKRLSGYGVCAAALAACGPTHESTVTNAREPTGCLAGREYGSLTHAGGMLFVGGGSFLMGAAPMREEEGPPRETIVGSFWIDRTEVTNREFAEFVAATGYVTVAERPLDASRYPQLSADQRKPSGIVFVGLEDKRGAAMGGWALIGGADWRHPSGPASSIQGRDDHPVVQVAWDDASAYAHWRGNDLPTEAEWEYAARGGLDGAPYVWGDKSPEAERPRANTWQGIFPAKDTGEDGYKAETAPVGCFPPNGFGLFDMAGNVWEWTNDWYAPGLNPRERRFPTGPDMADAFDPSEPRTAKHVIKGGSFLCADNYCLRYRPPARQAGPGDSGSSHIGFRTIRRAVGSVQAAPADAEPGSPR